MYMAELTLQSDRIKKNFTVMFVSVRLRESFLLQNISFEVYVINYFRDLVLGRFESRKYILRIYRMSSECHL